MFDPKTTILSVNTVSVNKKPFFAVWIAGDVPNLGILLSDSGLILVGLSKNIGDIPLNL